VHGQFDEWVGAFAASVNVSLKESDPGAFFVVTPYIGFYDKPCSDAFEQTIRDWPNRALATPVRDSALQDRMRVPGCHFLNASDFHYAPSTTEAERAKRLAEMEDENSGVAGDALLYLGPAASLTQSPMTPDIYLDTSFRNEISRRLSIMIGQPMKSSVVLMSPRYIRTYGGWSQDGPE
jgi:hypothetical protein